MLRDFSGEIKLRLEAFDKANKLVAAYRRII